jgi:hypothetical protein
MPIANELPLNKELQIELYPLEFKICFKCGLGQVGEPVTAERLFEDYRYASSTSKTWVEHAFEFTKKTINEIKFEKNDFVLEIASNDGYLLQHFNNSGIRTIGVEPAINMSQKANLKGIETINKFFGEQVAAEIRSQYGAPRLIVANNVLAHVPNINDFFSGINQLADINTVVTIENPSIINILNKNQFDTIYHEHFSYLSANSVSRLAEQHSLILTSVEKLGTHGGTNRYFLRKKGNGESDKKVYEVMEHEIEKGLFDRVIWEDTSRKIQKSIYEIGSWLRQKHQSGDKVIGFTAAAKTSTLINSAVHDSKFLTMVIDSSVEKQGRFIPYPVIPIVDVETAKKSNPTDIVIFSWNIYPEIKKLIQSEFDKSTKCWILIPEITQIK